MSGAVHDAPGRVSLVSRRRRPMLDPLLRSRRFFQIGLALAVAAVAGWGSFAYRLCPPANRSRLSRRSGMRRWRAISNSKKLLAT